MVRLLIVLLRLLLLLLLLLRKHRARIQNASLLHLSVAAVCQLMDASTMSHVVAVTVRR